MQGFKDFSLYLAYLSNRSLEHDSELVKQFLTVSVKLLNKNLYQL